MNNTSNFFTRLSDLESGAADLTRAQQPPDHTPRQRVDIVMCGWLAEWWVGRMVAREETNRAPAAEREPARVLLS